jgi:hypothetical protein
VTFWDDKSVSILWVLMVNENDATTEIGIYSQGWCVKPVFHLLGLWISGPKTYLPLGDGTLQKCQRSIHVVAVMLLSEHPWHPCYTILFVLEICSITILQINEWEICGNFSQILSREKRLFVIMCWSILFFKSSVMRDRHADHSSSWTYVLLSLNIQYHFFTFDLFITPSPYAAISWQ